MKIIAENPNLAVKSGTNSINKLNKSFTRTRYRFFNTKHMESKQNLETRQNLETSNLFV